MTTINSASRRQLRGIFGGSSGGSSPTLPEPNSLLFRHLTTDVTGSTVNDQTGVSSLTPRNLYCFSASEAGADASIPHGNAVAGASIDFDWADDWTLCGWIKTTESGAFNTRRILGNRVWSGDFQGVDLSFTAAGLLTLELYGDSSPAYKVERGMGGTAPAVVKGGSNLNTQAINDGEWRFFCISVAGDATPSNIVIKLYQESTNGILLEVKDSDALVETGTFGSQVLASGVDWFFANRNAGSIDTNTRFQNIKFYNAVKTPAEILDIYNKKDDTTNLIRDYGCSEETGSTLYNAAIVDTGNRLHGSISGSGSFGRTNDGVYSDANKYGYTLSGSVVIPYDKLGDDVDAAGTAIADAGKVKFDGERTSTTPFRWKPNPNGYDELVNLGFTSDTIIAGADRDVFKNNERSTQLFKNSDDTEFLAYDHPLRTFTKYTAATDEIGSAMTYLGHNTPLVWVGGQSNAVGSNTIVSGTNDLLQLDAKDVRSNIFIANNGGGTGTQSVTAFEAYDFGVNEDASEVDAMISCGYRLETYHDHELYVYKHAIGSTSLLSRSGDTLNHWHPTQDDGTGTRLYPGMINGLQEAVALLESTGRTVETFIYWDQGEADRGKTDDYAAALTALDSAVKTDEDTYEGKFIYRIGHTIHYDLVSPNIRSLQTAFVAADTTNRKQILAEFDSDWYTDTADVHLDVRAQEFIGEQLANKLAEFFGIATATENSLYDVMELDSADWVLKPDLAFTDFNSGLPIDHVTADESPVLGGFTSAGRNNPLNGSSNPINWSYDGTDFSGEDLFYAHRGGAPLYRNLGGGQIGIEFINGEDADFNTQPSTIPNGDILDFDIIFPWMLLRGAPSEAIFNSGTSGFLLKNRQSGENNMQFQIRGISAINGSAGDYISEYGEWNWIRIRVVNSSGNNGDYDMWLEGSGGKGNGIEDADTPFFTGTSTGWGPNGLTDLVLATQAHVASGIIGPCIIKTDGAFSSSDVTAIRTWLGNIYPLDTQGTLPYYYASNDSGGRYQTTFNGGTNTWEFTTALSSMTFGGGNGTEGTPLYRWFFWSSDSTQTTPALNSIFTKGNRLDEHYQIGGQVELTGGASGSVDSILAGGVEVLSGAVSFNTSLTQTAIDVAADINTGTGTHGWRAFAPNATAALGSAYVCLAPPSTHGPNGSVTIASTATTITTSDTNGPTGNSLDRDDYIGWFFDEGTGGSTHWVTYSVTPRDDDNNEGIEEIAIWRQDNTA